MDGVWEDTQTQGSAWFPGLQVVLCPDGAHQLGAKIEPNRPDEKVESPTNKGGRPAKVHPWPCVIHTCGA